MDDLPPATLTLLADQHGLLSTEQARQGGLTRAEVRWALQRRGRLVHPGVLATTTGRLSEHQRLVAAQLFAGPDAVLAASTAARGHGLDPADAPGRVRLLVPTRHASRAAPGVEVRRTRRPVQRTVERAYAQLLRRGGRPDVLAARR